MMLSTYSEYLEFFRRRWLFEYVYGYCENLKRFGAINDMYAAMKKNDMPELVMVALNIIQQFENLEPLNENPKCELKSNSFRNDGNKAYKNNEYQKALHHYNQALLWAPKNSQSMVLSYSNRSALLFHMNCFEESMIDIEKCLTLDCPPDILEKLTIRRKKCEINCNAQKIYKALRR
jgi:tetratricopeptide (TPR) repeat protein